MVQNYHRRFFPHKNWLFCIDEHVVSSPDVWIRNERTNEHERHECVENSKDKKIGKACQRTQSSTVRNWITWVERDLTCKWFICQLGHREWKSIQLLRLLSFFSNRYTRLPQQLYVIETRTANWTSGYAYTQNSCPREKPMILDHRLHTRNISFVKNSQYFDIKQ